LCAISISGQHAENQLYRTYRLVVVKVISVMANRKAVFESANVIKADISGILWFFGF
jgi:hypothetical protein